MKRLLSILIPLLIAALPFPAFGQGSTAFGNPVVTNGLGQPIAGATVAVCTANPGSAPTSLCTGLATTYTDVTIGTPCTGTKQALNNQAAPSVGSGCSNPGLSDGVGNVIVFSTSATYWCEYTGQGIIGIAVQLCVVPNSGGSGPGGAVLVIPTLTQNQNVVQPSAGGTSTGTSLNANVFEQVRYADQFQWSQSPSGTIAVGANTITINSIRGINQYSFSPGVNNFGSFSFVVHKIRVAGTGTPEVVTITGSTCVGASTGTCTITFTAANTHSAGYTVGTATAGFQEAVVDTFATSVANTSISGWTVKASPYLNTHNFTIYGTLNLDEIKGNVGGLHIDCEGAVLEDAVQGAAMIKIGGNSGAPNAWPTQTLIDHCHFGVSAGNLGRAANGTQVFVLDAGQGLSLQHNNFDAQNNADFVDYLVDVAGDQAFDFERNIINSAPMKCDATWCGVMVYGDPTNGSAIGTIANNYMNGHDAINWESGNGLTISGNVFQNWFRYPWRYRAGLTAVTNLGGNYYEGSNTINPDFGVAGFGANTGPQVGLSGTNVEYSPGVERGIVGITGHRFSATGGNVYTYYIVGHDGIGHSTRPLFVGDAATDGVTNFTVLFLKFGAATYDVLRSGPAVNDGTDAAPWGTGNWSVATGIVCAANPCSFTETFAAPGAYTIDAQMQSLSYTPVITYWPVPLFIFGTASSPAVYVGPGVRALVNATNQATANSYYDGIFTSESGGPGNITGMRILHLAPLQQSQNAANTNPGAMILNPDAGGPNGMINRKGRINMPSLSFQGGASPAWANNCMYQVFDPEADKTLATAGHQPLLKADGSDTCMGYDTNFQWLAFQGGMHAISFYLGHKFDSVSWIFQILSTGLTINKGISQSSGSGYQAIRSVAGCATAAAVGAACTTTVTWTTAFPNASYTPHCDGLGITSGVPLTGGITTPIAASVVFQTVAATAAAAQFTNIVCSAIHD